MQRISIQDRDLKLFRTLGRVVLMDRSMIQDAFFPLDTTGKACMTRLRLLTDHTFLARINFPIASFTDAPGELLTLYRLPTAGAELLFSLTGKKPERLLRTDPKPQTLLHRRNVARVMLAVDKAAELAKLPEVSWILEQDQRPGVPRRASRTQRHILYEDFSQEADTLQLRPDASSCLRIPGKKEGSWHDLLIWWEIDRSTEGHRVSEKIPAYNHFLRQQENDATGTPQPLYRRHWPENKSPIVRVFFVCHSFQRIQSIRSTICKLPGAEFVRLGTLDSLKPDHVLREPIWYDVLGKTHAIYPVISSLPQRHPDEVDR